MVDLSGYKDLTKPPAGTESGATAVLESAAYEKESETEQPKMTTSTTSSPLTKSSSFATYGEHGETDYDSSFAEYTGNVRTLLKLVSDLPNEVTKQSGAQVIRLTMEAMGISMENVLSEAQSAQSDLLDGVRTNIKKIEEYKTVIRKLESEIKSLQGKANELSEIIDLFILSNTSSNTGDKADISSY